MAINDLMFFYHNCSYVEILFGFYIIISYVYCIDVSLYYTNLGVQIDFIMLTLRTHVYVVINGS